MRMHQRAPVRLAVLLTALLVVAAACSDARPGRSGPGATGGGRGARTPNSTGPPPSLPGVTPATPLLASGFEQPICGRYQHPGPGCEFGYEGDDLETGSFDCRTGPSCLRINRVSHSHMGVIREVPLPDGHSFVGVAHRIPEIPEETIPPEPGYLELLQLSPTDGTPDLDGYPLELRLYPDRRLGLGLFREKDVVITRARAPVDEWFSTIVEVTNGVGATQRLWVFGSDGELVDSAEIDLDTSQRWPHSDRTAQKLGGVTSAAAAFETFHDDWWIAETFLGPVAIDAAGRPVEASG